MSEAAYDERYLLDCQAAATRYSISVRMLEEIYRGDPEFPVIRIGRRVLIHRTDADAYFDEMREDEREGGGREWRRRRW